MAAHVKDFGIVNGFDAAVMSASPKRDDMSTDSPADLPAEFIVRVATPDDASPVSALLKASFPVLMRASYDPAVLATALPQMTQANPVLLSSGTYYLAEYAGGSLVGCGGWTRGRPWSGEVREGWAHIRHFATHPDWTGRGVGRALLAKCVEEARCAGVSQLEVYASLNAEGFYTALGFKSVRRIEIPAGQGLKFSSIVMERTI